MFDWVQNTSLDSYPNFLYKRPDFLFEPQETGAVDVFTSNYQFKQESTKNTFFDKTSRMGACEMVFSRDEIRKS